AEQGQAPARQEEVGVRALPFARARSAFPSSFPLIAWRLIWIPAQEAQERRDAPSDRWLLQGVALAPAERLPQTWRKDSSENPGVLVSLESKPPAWSSPAPAVV